MPGDQPWYHLFVELDKEWFPAAPSFSKWISYETSETKSGVLVDLSLVNESVRRGRVSYRGQVFESEVNESYLCTVIWDVDCPNDEDRIDYLDLLVGESWEGCVVPWVPATARQFAHAYLEYDKVKTKESEDKNWWAVSMLFDTDSSEEKLKLILAIIDHADLPRDESGLGCVGAGPLEDLMSDWLLDRLEERIPNDPKLRYALSNVRMDFEEETLQHRVTELLSVG